MGKYVDGSFDPLKVTGGHHFGYHALLLHMRTIAGKHHGLSTFCLPVTDTD